MGQISVEISQPTGSLLSGNQQAANQEHVVAQFNIGVMYANGRGVEQSYQQAVEWYRKAAAQGYADAQFNLGIFYYNGAGIVTSEADAVYWLQLAARQGHEKAQNALGQLGQGW